jgi:hypothetical protein
VVTGIVAGGLAVVTGIVADRTCCSNIEAVVAVAAVVDVGNSGSWDRAGVNVIKNVSVTEGVTK